MGISDELYELIENYLSGRFQRVILNGQTSSWRPIVSSTLTIYPTDSRLMQNSLLMSPLYLLLSRIKMMKVPML